MSFGLKNTGATYQRAMTRIFDDLIHNQVECYIDDVVLKSKVKEAHLYDLRVVFERLRRYDLKMNPLKCAFGVTSEKFLGFVVRHHGIEIDHAKIEAILDMPSPKSLTQLRSLQGRLAYIRRFISNLYGRCQPFSVLAKKDTKFVWDEKCQNAFDDIKQYLSNPPVLAAPVPGKPLILYTAALDESLGALLAQVNDEGKENALYYLSRRLLLTEIRYPSIEKHYLALVFAA
ncbi:putative mitochondrial protein [Dendrobium catenatum]|uniref:Putative mitochondrial protein n=1 Tax=Dendrobium catenatum TaxID=906689 RepID=A0A2I0WIE0_9ASPA|nr:putative mitochondrial protein [Dendrobium catenatum]